MSEYRRGEFEGRNRQLPADLDTAAPYSTLEKSRESFDRTPSGTPPKCYDVRSTYDVRPINAFDFNIVDSDTATEALPDLTLTMTVPQGFVAVLRNIDIWTVNVIAAQKADQTWSLQLDGADYPYNVNVPFGTAVDRETVFLIANEFQRIGVKLILPAADYAIGDEGYVRFYGNFLLKDDIPANFQIANPTADCQPSAQRNAPTPRAPAPPVRSAPVPSAAPLPAPSVKPAVPPYPVRFHQSADRVYARASLSASARRATHSGNLLIPYFDLPNGRERVVTKDEIITYHDFFNNFPLKPKEREWFGNYLQSIGL